MASHPPITAIFGPLNAEPTEPPTAYQASRHPVTEAVVRVVVRMATGCPLYNVRPYQEAEKRQIALQISRGSPVMAE